MSANPFENAARLRKTQDLVVAIWADLTPEKRRDAELPAEVNRATERFWELAAEKAQVNRPSEYTRRLVVLALARMVTAERRAHLRREA